jgi:hypothetical protein
MCQVSSVWVDVNQGRVLGALDGIEGVSNVRVLDSRWLSSAASEWDSLWA